MGGLVAMPGLVTGEGNLFQPELLIWLNSYGAVLGSKVGKPGELLMQACESLQATIDRPNFGLPHAPDRVRVASPGLADILLGGHPSIDVVCEPTPELDAMMAAMFDKLVNAPEEEPSYLFPRTGPEAIAGLFRAAAKLFRAKPWSAVPGELGIISVTIDKFGVKNAALSFIGQMGKHFGLLVFSSIEDFEVFVAAGDALAREEVPTMPPHLTLAFKSGADLSPSLRKEIVDHHWEVAGAKAYPTLVAYAENFGKRPPTPEEVATTEAIALALPMLLKETQPLIVAWNGGEPVSRTFSVPTHAGEVEVSFCIPDCLEESSSPQDLLAKLRALGKGRREIDPDARQPIEEELLRRFAASPEAKGLDDVQLCQLVMDLAADDFNATIATLTAEELNALIFEVIPRRVAIDASAATFIIEENRALYVYLKREFGLEQADACGLVLGRDAVKRLEAALSDKSKFGMTKSLMAEGREAGFDLESNEGIETWMRDLQSSPLPASVRLPSVGAAPKPARKGPAGAKKNKRKGVRKGSKRGG